MFKLELMFYLFNLFLLQILLPINLNGDVKSSPACSGNFKRLFFLIYVWLTEGFMQLKVNFFYKSIDPIFFITSQETCPRIFIFLFSSSSWGLRIFYLPSKIAIIESYFHKIFLKQFSFLKKFHSFSEFCWIFCSKLFLQLFGYFQIKFFWYFLSAKRAAYLVFKCLLNTLNTKRVLAFKCWRLNHKFVADWAITINFWLHLSLVFNYYWFLNWSLILKVVR